MSTRCQGNYDQYVQRQYSPDTAVPVFGPGFGSYGWSHMMSPAGSVLMMLLIVVVVFFLVNRMVRRSSCSSEAPLGILDRRYAQGEITLEDFERMKQDIKD